MRRVYRSRRSRGRMSPLLMGSGTLPTAPGGDPSGGLDNLLLETGDNLLLESSTDDVLLLE